MDSLRLTIGGMVRSAQMYIRSMTVRSRMLSILGEDKNKSPGGFSPGPFFVVGFMLSLLCFCEAVSSHCVCSAHSLSDPWWQSGVLVGHTYRKT